MCEKPNEKIEAVVKTIYLVKETFNPLTDDLSEMIEKGEVVDLTNNPNKYDFNFIIKW